MLTIDMSVNHVSFPLRKFRSPALCHPLKKMWYRGASPKPGNVQQRSSPQLQKVCASGQREEFNIVFFFVFVFVVFVVFVVCIVCCFFCVCHFCCVCCFDRVFVFLLFLYLFLPSACFFFWFLLFLLLVLFFRHLFFSIFVKLICSHSISFCSIPSCVAM